MVKLRPNQQAKLVDAKPEVCVAFGGQLIDAKDALAIAWTNVAKIVQLPQASLAVSSSSSSTSRRDRFPDHDRPAEGDHRAATGPTTLR